MSLKSFNLNEPGQSDVISKSICLWIDDGFYNSSGIVSRSENLKRVKHPEYTSQGFVWGSDKKNWAWEGVEPNFFTNGSGIVPSKINYKEGLVFFNNILNNLSGNYTYKHINIFNVSENEFFRGSNLINNYSGVYREESIQLPCIALEMGSSSSKPHQLGSYYRKVNQEILLNIFHRNSDVVERISDILYNQVDSTVKLFDFHQAYRDGAYPLELNGVLINRSGRYDYLVENYPYSGAGNSCLYIEDTEQEKTNKIANELYHATVRFKLYAELKMGTN
jgi:hypothetical protein